jgi:hypothetical protein
MLAPSLAAPAGKTRHRFTTSSPDSALGRRERSLGRSAIHGELLKLGIAVSERTVSRYLPDRLTAPSQTWRTFLANHLGGLALTSPVTSSSAPRDDDVDACVLPFGSARLGDGPCAANQWAVVDGPLSFRRTSIGWRVAQDLLHDRTRTRPSSGRDPPTVWGLAMPDGVRPEVPFIRCLHLGTANERSETNRSRGAGSAVLSRSLSIGSSTSPEGQNVSSPATKQTAAL